jgi:hypothetical protein
MKCTHILLFQSCLDGKLLEVSKMKKHLFAAVIFAAGVGITGPTFASGYGPDSHYNPIAGTPASQRGPSSQTLHAENIANKVSAEKVAGAQSYGGAADSTSNWGSPTASVETGHAFYAHH